MRSRIPGSPTLEDVLGPPRPRSRCRRPSRSAGHGRRRPRARPRALCAVAWRWTLVSASWQTRNRCTATSSSIVLAAGADADLDLEPGAPCRSRPRSSRIASARPLAAQLRRVQQVREHADLALRFAGATAAGVVDRRAHRPVVGLRTVHRASAERARAATSARPAAVRCWPVKSCSSWAIRRRSSICRVSMRVGQVAHFLLDPVLLGDVLRNAEHELDLAVGVAAEHRLPVRDSGDSRPQEVRMR